MGIMAQAAAAARWLAFGSIIAMLLALSGCVTTPIGPIDPTESGSGHAPENPADGAGVNPPGDPATHSALPQGEPLLIVIDDPHHDELALMRVFAAGLKRPYRILNLANRDASATSRIIGARAPVQVIAIGDSALAVAAGVPDADVVYAGVLNPVGGNRGVDALPPFDVQLAHWLELSPGIGRLGVIGGRGMSDRMDDLAAACADLGLELDQRIVASDRESLLAFRSMVPRIDGFVFLPDGEVLSPAVIEKMLGHGRRNRVEMLVYSPLMLELGGSLLVRTDPVAVATAVMQLLNDPGGEPAVRTMEIVRRAEDSPVLVSLAMEPADG
jgi:hypothetical protein